MKYLLLIPIIWLIGSAIRNLNYHIGNYFKRTAEGGYKIESFNELISDNIFRVLLLELTKISIAIYLLWIMFN